MTETQTTIKTATGQSIGVGAGNALAYVLLEFLTWKYEWIPDDPAVFVVMVGTLMGVAALQFSRIVGGFVGVVKYVFDRIFPDKYDHEHHED